MIDIETKEINKFKKACKRAYPNECCGFLIGTEDCNNIYISNIYIPEDQELQASPDEIIITEDWWEDAEGFAAENNLNIVGFIHSHPGYKDVSLSETDLNLTDFLKEELININNPVMGILGIWETPRGLNTRIGIWPMFNQHKVNLV